MIGAEGRRVAGGGNAAPPRRARPTIAQAGSENGAPHDGRTGARPPGLVWVSCPHPAPALETVRALEAGFRVHRGTEPSAREQPSCVVLCQEWRDSAEEDVASEVGRAREKAAGAPVLVLCPSPEPRLAKAALRAGAGGFLHAGMRPEDLLRAVSLVGGGRIVIPRVIVADLVGEDLFLSLPVVLGSWW